MDRVWIEYPIFFITTCTLGRRKCLTSENAAGTLVDEWRNAALRYGWVIGRYVIMPDHVHFFCSAAHDAKRLSVFMGAWKQWTSKQLGKEQGFSGSLWQTEFLDHILRSGESYTQKWNYVRDNPVRDGLVMNSGDWPWQGEIEVFRF